MDTYRRDELPETVRRYKIYTDQFQEWLIMTAAARDVDLADLQNSRQNNGRSSSRLSIEQQERLVDGITRTDDPLDDTSGLQDLRDALRSRKEVSQYYKSRNYPEDGHAYFNNALERYKTKLARLVPSVLKSNHTSEKTAKPRFAWSSGASFKKADSDGEDENTEPLESLRKDSKGKKGVRTPLITKLKRVSLTEEELELQKCFNALSFFYEYHQIRATICEIWTQYRAGDVSMSTAALVTDMAQSHIEQSITALIEDNNIKEGLLFSFIADLFSKMDALLDGDTAEEKFLKESLPELLCLGALQKIHQHLAVKNQKTVQWTTNRIPNEDDVSFLDSFEEVKKADLPLPILDTFTEDMLLSETGSKDRLPFSLQIVLDIHLTLGDDYASLYHNIMKQCLDTARMVREHVEYEDSFWDTDLRPDYMARGSFKLSSHLIKPIGELLDWLNTTFLFEDDSEDDPKMATAVAMGAHITLPGLTLWHFNQVVQNITIRRVQWFIINLCHLYNAVKHVGGLDTTWPDLDFIIERHGAQRIFPGGAPTDPADFHSRYRLAICASGRPMASDYRGKRGDYVLTPSKDIREKRGLVSTSPLQENFKEYYEATSPDDRWLKRHAIFNRIHTATDPKINPGTVGSEQTRKKFLELQKAFTSMAGRIAPPKSKEKARKAHVSIPDFPRVDATFPKLFLDMKSELQAQELHDKFDYLSFYRRSYWFMAAVRNDILFNKAAQARRRKEPTKLQNPTNVDLLGELFQNLDTKVWYKKNSKPMSGPNNPSYTRSVEQLEKIATFLSSFIDSWGSVDLNRAKMRRDFDWEGLNASYAAAPGPWPDEEYEDVVEEDIDEGDEGPAVEVMKEVEEEAEEEWKERLDFNRMTTETRQKEAARLTEARTLEEASLLKEAHKIAPTDSRYPRAQALLKEHGRKSELARQQEKLRKDIAHKREQLRLKEIAEQNAKAREEEAAKLQEQARKKEKEEEEAAEAARKEEASRLRAETRMLKKARRREAREQARLAEAARLEEEARLAEETRLAQIAEQLRSAEEIRLAEVAEQLRIAEVARLAELAEQSRLAEVARLAEIGEQLRIALEARVAAAVRLEEERRLAEEARIAEEEERRLAEEARIAKELQLKEERRSASEARIAAAFQLEEDRRLADEYQLAEDLQFEENHRLAEEARIAEATRKADELRKAEETRIAEAVQVEKERRLAEVARQADKQRRAKERHLAHEARTERHLLALEARSPAEARRAEERRLWLAQVARNSEEHWTEEAIRKAKERHLAEQARQAEASREAEASRQAEASHQVKEREEAQVVLDQARESIAVRVKLEGRMQDVSRLLRVLDAHQPDDPNGGNLRAMRATLNEISPRLVRHPYPPIRELYRIGQILDGYYAEIWRRYGYILFVSGEVISGEINNYVESDGCRADEHDRDLIDTDDEASTKHVQQDNIDSRSPTEAATDYYEAKEEVETGTDVEVVSQVEVRAAEPLIQHNIRIPHAQKPAIPEQSKRFDLLDNSSKPVSTLHKENLASSDAVALKRKPTYELLVHSTKRVYRPRGIFHRILFSNAPSYRRRVKIQRTSTGAQFKLPRLPKRLIFCSYTGTKKRNATLRHFVRPSQRHSISMPCHAKCSLAKILLQRETVFRRRLKLAYGMLKQNGRCESHDLLSAWDKACVSLPRPSKTTFEEYGDGWEDVTGWIDCSDFFGTTLQPDEIPFAIRARLAMRENPDFHLRRSVGGGAKDQSLLSWLEGLSA